MKAFENMNVSYSFEYRMKVFVLSSFNHINVVTSILLSKLCEIVNNYYYCFMQLLKSLSDKTLLFLNAEEVANLVFTNNNKLSVTLCKFCTRIFQLFYFYCYNFVLLSNKLHF